MIISIGWPTLALAWSSEGHILITRTAVRLLLDDPSTPAALQALLREGSGKVGKLDGLESIRRNNAGRFGGSLDFYSFRPDELVGLDSPVPGFNSAEEFMHYLNLELFQPEPARQNFAVDGSNKVTAAMLPRDPLDKRYQSAGFVTFRVEQCYRSLVESLEHNYSDEQVFLWLGFLSHYLGDSYQPYHSTIDYQGLNCSCNRGRREPHHFHREMEGALFVDDSPNGKQLRARCWRFFQDALNDLPAAKNNGNEPLDPYLSAQNALLSGYDYLPMLCRAGNASLAHGEFDLYAWFNYREKVGDREISVLQLKAERMAQAALTLRTLIRQAWQEAASAKIVPPKRSASR